MDKNTAQSQIVSTIQYLTKELSQSNVQLVAVSKKQSIANIRTAYESGLVDFGENYVQELVEKFNELPKDIQWHFIGHLQSNKVKLIAPFVHLIHGVDTVSLYESIAKEALKNNRQIAILLQIRIAKEDTKFGILPELALHMVEEMIAKDSKHVKIKGVMGMATFTDDENQIIKEYNELIAVYNALKEKFFKNDAAFNVISGGMSNDYKLAVQAGCNLVRIGSSIFGART